jgi:DUF4097 and DUF4098 domain-containing protein YvlB
MFQLGVFNYTTLSRANWVKHSPPKAVKKNEEANSGRTGERGKLMKRKWWIVGTLVILELLVCGGMLLALWGGRAIFQGARFFYRADTHVEETVEKTFVVDGPAVLDLEALAGNVTVTGGTESEVQVTARLSLWGADEEDARQQLDLHMTQEGNRITIQVVRPQRAYVGFAFTRSSRADFEIRVPSQTSLQLASSSGDLAASEVTGGGELRTVSGNIGVDELQGALSVQSSSGDITLTGLNDAGDLEVGTVSGDVKLQDVEGDSLTAHTSSGKIQIDEGTLGGALDLETVSGDVAALGIRATSCRLASSSGKLTLEGCSGRLEMQTVSGGIEVNDARDVELGLSTSSGEVRFSGSLGAGGEHRLESVSGNMHLILPADAAFDLDIETISGDIQTGFPVTMAQFGERHVLGTVNGGGPLLQINTSSGDVTLETATDNGN